MWRWKDEERGTPKNTGRSERGGDERPAEKN